jgi:signal transduction histidine kinase
MFNSLRARLWLTYVFLVGVVLVVIGAALVTFLIRYPEEDRLAVQRLGLLSTIIIQQAQNLQNTPPDRLQLLVERADNLFNVRVVVLDPQGDTLADSRSVSEAPLPGTALLDNRSGTLPLFRDARRKAWLYSVHTFQSGSYLVLAVPRPKLPIARILQSEFSAPFRRAGLLAIGLALILAVLIARWVSAPLQRIASAARQAASGEYHPISLEGPSEARDLAKAFNEMTGRVIASQQSQRDFVANVSHELKTPLTSIQGFAQAILDGTVEKPDELHQAAEVIYAESGRMHRLVLNLLDLARLDAGTADLERKFLDLNELLDGVVEKFALLARNAHVQITKDWDNLPLIQGDADKLSQVFTNLVDNAIKHTPAGGKVSLKSGVVESQIEVSVVDTGPGISPEDMPRIFERFYQTDKSRRGGSGRGVGLGLAIAYEIVQAHGGSLEVYNNSPQGSVFVVKLSVARWNDSSLSKRKE